MRTNISSLKDTGWEPPDNSDLNFQFDFGDSVLSEFILSHNLGAIIKELIQNEYDAKGQTLKVNFGRDHLDISGSGEIINAQGWQRLSVVLGTGNTSNSKRNIKPKVNGIGSKNFGLRSLFLLGNTIYISSGGKRTVLDITKGALPKPVKDNHSNRKKGVSIKVPYRVVEVGKLKPFTLEQEQEALSKLGQELTHTLIKLAQPNTKKNLKEVLVTSERCNQQFQWKQTVKAVPCKIQGVRALRRKIRMHDSRTGKTQIIEELEFQKIFSLPPEFQDQNIPSYFRVKGEHIRLSLSIRLNKGKINVSEPGLFYYPLGVNNGFTGTAISISAPFQMDTDRSQLIDPQNDEFNKWLLKTVAELTITLLIEDWYERFGFVVYHGISRITQPALSFYIEQLNSKLKGTKCWATRAKDKNSKNRTLFETANEVVIPENSLFTSFLSDIRYLDESISSDPKLRDFAENCGVKIFNINSLIRLRCTHEERKNLKTQAKDNEANYQYNDDNYLKKESFQLGFAKAIDAQKNLISVNLADLKNIKATLSANGELNSISAPLWVVNPKIASVCPVPESQRLHPSLVPFKIFSKLGRIFNVTDWVNDVIAKIRTNNFSEEERLTLYNYLLSVNGHLSRKLAGSLREIPILRDHKGNWVEPRLIILKNAGGANQLKEVLHFPHPDYEKNEELAVLFRFKTRITSEDLIKFARLIKFSPELAPKFEKILIKFDDLLSKNVINQLKGIDFLCSSKKTIARPSSLYIQNQINRTCLGSEALFVVGSKFDLYKTLGCLEHPKQEDIIAHIFELSSRNQKPSNPEDLYEQLIKALKKEEVPLDFYQDANIIWTGNNYSRPLDMLVGLQYKRIFLDSVPIVSNISKTLYESYTALGVHKKPQDSHWLQFFSWIDKKYREAGNKLNEIEKNALREAYTQLIYLPQLPTNVKCFLDGKGRLHDSTEIQNDSFLIDDNPQLSSEIEKLNLSISFADVVKEGTIQFYENKAKVKRLTDISELTGYQTDGKKTPPPWLHKDKILEKLHDDYFIDAVKTLTGHTLKIQTSVTPAKLKAKLRSIKKILFAETLNGMYRIKDKIVPVPMRIVLRNNQIVLTDIQNENDLYGLLSQSIADLFTSVIFEARNLADAIYRLLSSNSTKEMKDYLFYHRGISWEPHIISDSEESIFLFDDDLFSTMRETEQIGEILTEISQNLLQQPDKNSEEDKASEPKSQPEPQKKPVLQPEFKLPELENVLPEFSDTSGNLKQRSSRKKKGYTGNWQPPTPQDTARDQLVGRRGEELVFREELKRVKKLGFDESQVVKTYETNPTADHDIKSVNEKGEDIWIEVKSTTGRSGKFNWSKNEFEKALKKRKNYILWRVYEAHTTTPIFKVYVDPISYLLKSQMRLDIANLSAEVEALEKR